MDEHDYCEAFYSIEAEYQERRLKMQDDFKERLFRLEAWRNNAIALLKGNLEARTALDDPNIVNGSLKAQQ